MRATNKTSGCIVCGGKIIRVDGEFLQEKADQEDIDITLRYLLKWARRFEKCVARLERYDY